MLKNEGEEKNEKNKKLAAYILANRAIFRKRMRKRTKRELFINYSPTHIVILFSVYTEKKS